MIKLVLGSANFNKKYGINNDRVVNINKIFDYCNKNNINYLDTAFAYSGSHKIILQNKKSNFKIITKLDLKKKKYKNLEKSLFNFVERLKKNKIYSILIHNTEDFINFKDKELILNLFHNLKKKNIIKKFGVSVYNIDDLKKIIRFFKPEIIQIPFNVIDERFFRSKWFLRLVKENKIEIMVRSCFLQGLLLKKKIPRKFRNYEKYLKKFINWCNNNNLSQLQACIYYIKQFKKIKFAVFGVKNLKEMEAINDILKKDISIKIPSFYHKNINDLIDPRLW